MKVGLFLIAAFFFVTSIYSEPQIKPFLFTISPSTSTDQKVTLHFDAGLGDGSLGFSDAPSADSRIGVKWNLNSRWMFLGNTSFGKDDSHIVKYITDETRCDQPMLIINNGGKERGL